MSREPRRTCIGCRQVRSKSALVRLVRERDGRVELDAVGARPGRGAYACPSQECLTRALAKGRLEHAFRRSSVPPGAGVAGILERLGETTRTE